VAIKSGLKYIGNGITGEAKAANQRLPSAASQAIGVLFSPFESLAHLAATE
jgi:hypothetical protein